MSVASGVPDCIKGRKKRTVVTNEMRQLLTMYFNSTQGQLKPKEACHLLNIGFENSRKLLRQLRRGESIMRADPKKSKRRKLLPEHDVIIGRLIREDPAISSQKVANMLSSSAIIPVTVSRSTIHRHRLEQMNSSKKMSLPPDPDGSVLDRRESSSFSSLYNSSEPSSDIAIALPSVSAFDQCVWWNGV